MRLLVDTQLPIALATHLRTRGHDCQHVLDLGWDSSPDFELWRLAGAQGFTLISKDEDFVFLANRPGDSGRLVWVRLGNCRNQALLAAFDNVHEQMVAAFDAGQRIVEVR